MLLIVFIPSNAPKNFVECIFLKIRDKTIRIFFLFFLMFYRQFQIARLQDGIFIDKYTRVGNELFNVTGMAIDFLEGMSEHFKFK